jgi:hypothetical protein
VDFSKRALPAFDKGKYLSVSQTSQQSRFAFHRIKDVFRRKNKKEGFYKLHFSLIRVLSGFKFICFFIIRNTLFVSGLLTVSLNT